MPGGRPTKCTPELIDRAVEHTKEGLYFEDVCWLCGVAPQKGYEWLQKAEEDGTDPIYKEFRDAIKEAEAHAQRAALGELRHAANGEGSIPWQSRAWFLERRWPKKYGRTTVEVEHTGTVTTQVIALETGDSIEALKAARDAARKG